MLKSKAITIGCPIEPKMPLGFTSGAEQKTTSGLITDDSDAGLITIAGTGTGKGVSQVIPTALTFPGSMVIVDIKGEIAAITARARREMGQEVVILDPFGDSKDALNPMEAIDPASIDAYDQCKRIARMMCANSFRDDPFWDDMATQIVSGTLLFLATHIQESERSLSLLYRMWGVADHLEEMLAAMLSCNLHGGAMIAAAKAYVDAPDKTSGSILTSLRSQIDFLASPRSKASLEGGWGLLKKIRDGVPLTIYLRVPPEMLTSHAKLLRVWIGTILNTVASRSHRPEIPDLFLVDEAATLGRLDELLTASSLLRGYGLRTWTFWQSFGQMSAIYEQRAFEMIDNAGTLSMFGAANASSADRMASLTGYGGQILGMDKAEQIICRQGGEPLRARLIDYRSDPRFSGLFDPNPFHAGPPAPTPLREVAA